MADLKNPTAIWTKGILFLVMGFLSAGLLLIRQFSVQNLFLLLITVWSFCRFYYFIFYVIENYVDDGFKYAGLLDFLLFWTGWKRRN